MVDVAVYGKRFSIVVYCGKSEDGAYHCRISNDEDVLTFWASAEVLAELAEKSKVGV